MRLVPRPSVLPLALLFPLALAACDTRKEAPKADPAALAPAPGTTVPAKPAPEPGEKGYVAPASTKQIPPLLQATMRGNLEAVRSLLESNDIDPDVEHQGVTALHYATGEHMTEIVKVLLDHKADPNHRQAAGATALHIAASTADGLPLAKLLVEHGADVNAKDKKGRTPLIAAASTGQLDVVQLLLDKGAEVNVQPQDGATALHAAVLFGHKEIVATLLAVGANVNLADGQKNTPLHYAAREGHKEIAELLMANGAEILAKTVENVTAYQVAVFFEHEDLAKYLQELEIAAGGTGTEADPSQKPELPGQAPKKPRKKKADPGEGG